MKKVVLTKEEKEVITMLNDPLYTVEFIEEWVNRDDNVFTNAPAALQCMSANGFYRAVKGIVEQRNLLKGSDQE